jgi:hypothetical protein
LRPIIVILNKVFVQEFYRSNASFFLVVIGLGAGFLRSYEHIALAEFFISSPFLLLIPTLLWILYTVKVVRFNVDTIGRNENEFLYCLSLLPKKKQWITLTGAISVQLMPVILYSAFLFSMALKNNMRLALLLISTNCLSLILLSSFVFLRALNHPHIERHVWAVTGYLNARFVKPFFLFFPEWIIRRQALMIIGTKFFSCLLLFGVSQLYTSDTEQYDLRLFGMGTVLAFSANINMVWEMHRFDNFHFAILRNLPLQYGKRVAFFVYTFVLLMLPETGIIVRHLPPEFDAVDMASVILFGWSIPVLFYGYMYRKDMGQDQLTPLVFFTGISLIILILFKIPLLVLAVVNLSIGLIIWRKYYYTYEQVSNIEDP